MEKETKYAWFTTGSLGPSKEWALNQCAEGFNTRDLSLLLAPPWKYHPPRRGPVSGGMKQVSTRHDFIITSIIRVLTMEWAGLGGGGTEWLHWLTWNPKYRTWNLKNSFANALPGKTSLKTPNLAKVYDLWGTTRWQLHNLFCDPVTLAAWTGIAVYNPHS